MCKPSAVRSTGQGCKIFVSASQTIDADHAAALRAVALSQPMPPSFEGTALGPPPVDCAPECELRYALIAPRLVGPHPNVDPQRPISAAEGVALLAQGRFRGLKARSDRHEDVPDPDDPDTAGDWTWRFVAAIWDWAMTDSTVLLEAVLESAPDLRSAAASGVFVACALARMERHSDAIAALTPLAEDDQMDSVDRAWVLVQRARASGEIGDFQNCRADAPRSTRTARRPQRRPHRERDRRCRRVASVHQRSPGRPRLSTHYCGVGHESFLVAVAEGWREGWPAPWMPGSGSGHRNFP